MKTFRVGNFGRKERFIGKDQPIFIAAEIGVTCGYEVEKAKKLIDVVKDSGADAVKLAFHFPDDLLSDHSVEYSYVDSEGNKSENMFEMFDSLRFTFDEWKEIKEYADEKEVFMFASSAGGLKGIEWAEKLDFSMHKIGAWDLLDIPQWNRLVKSEKPVIADVGTVTEEEMALFMEICKDLDIVLLHEYHSHDYNQMNLRSLPYIEDRFDTLVGFSSPDSYDVNDFISVALGAVVLEKRLTLSRNTPGHHHVLGKHPDEFKKYVQKIRQAEKALGLYRIQPTDKDLQDREKYFKRVVAREAIKAGDVLTEENITCKRPAGPGISSRDYYSVIGKVVNVDLKKNDPILEDSFS